MESLNQEHPRQVLCNKGDKSGQPGSRLLIGLLQIITEQDGNDRNDRKYSQRVSGKGNIQLEHKKDNHNEHHAVTNQTEQHLSKELADRLGITGYVRDQTSAVSAVKEGHGHSCDVFEQIPAQRCDDALSGKLEQIVLDIRKYEADNG